MSRCRIVLLLVLLCQIRDMDLNAEEIGIRAPEGFEVSLYADDALAHDIFSMTIDSHGRVVVAGKGYVKILRDTDNDGRADKATMFSEIPKSGAHGMAFLGNDLVCTGDNSVMLLRDKDGDGKADGKPEIWANLRHPEHGANGVTIGPDGWIYVICGNDAGVSEKHATLPTSPVEKPQCGAVVRFSPDGKNSEIIAHGFRNPYDMAFNSYGHMFTVDADGERDQYLPWYTPTRLFDIAVGQHHGWVLNGWKRSWNRPEYFFDNVPRLAEIGRGSPTGVEVYRHRQFPTHYYDGVFSCCWTLGRVYYFPLKVKGSSYETKKESFLETTGDVGFAPVDLAVGPNGDLFVAIGGRGTRGSVFRVSYGSKARCQSKEVTCFVDL
jgi:putative membrane-bound dehydrogenase-like protein